MTAFKDFPYLNYSKAIRMINYQCGKTNKLVQIKAFI